jgi:hypothetical protein
MEFYLMDDIWREIKTYIFHNINIHGIHLKNKPDIKNYNQVMKNIPHIYRPRLGPRIIYNPSKCGFKSVKFIYKLPAPCTLSNKRYSLKYKLIIEYMAVTNLNEKQIRQAYYSQYYT